ncbi:MAG TPA: winged helix-turn-helix domain-containing protein [Stenotrophomonas sp.]|nr:winged helix-turn-helix domain-containing protein [Stenotrophomonas sp.]
MQQPAPGPLAFEDVIIDFAGRRLLRAGVDQALEPKAFAVLALLAASPGRVFAREQILDAVWGHRDVTESVLNRIMSLLRQVLGENAQRPRLLHAVHGAGYRFELPRPAAAVPGKSPPVPGANRKWRLAALFAAVLVLGAVVAWLLHQHELALPPTSAPRSLAVLPFADISDEGGQEYLAEGLAEEVLIQLAQSPSLRVVGRTSSFSFKGQRKDFRDIGRMLGAAYLLEGSMRRDGDELRVSARLLRADDGTHLWSGNYARELRDVFAVQEEIARDVALALSVKLDAAQFIRSRGGPTNVEAYQRYLRWRSIAMQEPSDLDHDRECLQLAREMVALEPRCVQCRDALARSLEAMAQEIGGPQAGKMRDEAVQVREDIARNAPGSWVARRDRANSLWRQGHRAEAIALSREVMGSGPANKERAWDYAYLIYAMGHLEEAIALVEQVRAVEPRALFLSRDLQFDYTAARRYADAEAEYRRGQALGGDQSSPDYVAFMRQLAGKRPGGLPALRELHGRLREQAPELATPFFRDLGLRLGDREGMRALVRRALLDEAYGGDASAAYVLTNVADALGDAELAVRSLRRELEAQSGFKDGTMPQFPYVAFWNSPYSGLRAHPQFKRLLRETGVVDYWRQTGRWGDGCAPVGADDFACQ